MHDAHSSGPQTPPTNHQFEVEGIDIDDAIDEYLAARAGEISDGTETTHESRLNIFIGHLEDEGVETTDEIHPRHLQAYKRKRLKEVKPVTLDGQLDTVTVFLRTLEHQHVVEPGLHQYVPDVEVEPEEERRTAFLDVEVGDKILEHQRKYNYGNVEHVIFEMMWSTTMRICEIRAVDVDDYDSDKRMIRLRHRPETGTALKNKLSSERPVSLPQPVSDAIDDYLDNPDRHDVEDDYGRKPLISSDDGRLGNSTIRNIIYELTEPCQYSGECPHDKDPNECKAAVNRNHASKCPSSLSPHPIRRGAITRQRKRGISRELVSERSDVSPRVLKNHYEQLTDEEIVKARRDEFDDEYE